LKALVRSVSVTVDSLTLNIELQDPAIDSQMLSVYVTSVEWLAWKTDNPGKTVGDFLKEKIVERVNLLKETIKLAGMVKNLTIDIP